MSILHWIAFKSPNHNWHLFGSHIVFGRVERRFQVLISMSLRRGKRISFGWGPRWGS